MYVIVKYAAPDWSRNNFADDYVVDESDSAHTTFTGKQVGLPATFATEQEATPWLDRMVECNPSVGYAICEVGKVIHK